MDRLAHWNQVYASKASADVSWFQASPTLSLDLIQATGVPRTARILDVGGGTSRLVDCLLDAGYSRVGVLDIAKASLAEARYRIGSAAGQVEWFVGDVTGFQTPHSWEVWHDRAVFHFLTDAADRAAYRNALLQCLSPEGHLILATFGPEGPTRCSGLEVVRYGPDTLGRELGEDFQLVESRWEEHRTPAGALQQFVYCRFRRLGS
jgi:SAM-dependent methyltransferase